MSYRKNATDTAELHFSEYCGMWVTRWFDRYGCLHETHSDTEEEAKQELEELGYIDRPITHEEMIEAMFGR